MFVATSISPILTHGGVALNVTWVGVVSVAMWLINPFIPAI